MGNDYELSYVNMPNDVTKNYDRKFKSLIQLVAFVARMHPDYESYQIIVLKSVRARRGQ